MSFSDQQARKEYFKARVLNIRKQVSVFQLLSYYGIPVRTDNYEVQYPCPLHGDGQDQGYSARAYPDDDGQGGSTYCWACHKARDVVEWVKDREGLSFTQALSVLEERFGITDKPNINLFFSPKHKDTSQEESQLSKDLSKILDKDTTKDVSIPFHLVERQIDRLVGEKRDVLSLKEVTTLYYVLDKAKFALESGEITHKKTSSILAKLAAKINGLRCR
jgi:hypothetical protein